MSKLLYVVSKKELHYKDRKHIRRRSLGVEFIFEDLNDARAYCASEGKLDRARSVPKDNWVSYGIIHSETYYKKVEWDETSGCEIIISIDATPLVHSGDEPKSNSDYMMEEYKKNQQ